jgi:L-fuculose-phosphate aldolase
MTIDHELKELVALSCRVLADQGHEHFIFGHVSTRVSGSDLAYVKSAGMALGEVRPQDVAEVNLDGRPSDRSVQLHDELPLHLAIYESRPDIGAIVHTHADSAVLFSIASEDFPIYCQDAIPFRNRISFYHSAALITTAEHAVALASCLGLGRAVILRAHGLAAVGADLREATVNAVMLDRALRTTLGVLRASQGVPSPIRDDEAAKLDEHFERSRASRIAGIWRQLADAAAA